MSVLAKKKVLVVGGEHPLLMKLADTLHDHEAIVTFEPYSAVTRSGLEENKIDFILLNALSSSEESKHVLDMLQTANLTKAVPVFVLLEEEKEAIENALNQGASDFITTGEGVTSILQKIMTIYGDNEASSTGTVIDITPHHPNVTTKGVRVYVVEDDPLLRNLLAIRFDRSDFLYEFSTDGDRVAIPMKQFAPDIVLLDLMLPGKNGLDVLKEIKDDPALKEIPVIVFSNRDGQDDRARAKELGAVGFHVKAMTDLSELVETIESHIK
jgi:DNA-binding response OmpR family regulator